MGSFVIPVSFPHGLFSSKPIWRRTNQALKHKQADTVISAKSPQVQCICMKEGKVCRTAKTSAAVRSVLKTIIIPLRGKKSGGDSLEMLQFIPSAL